MKDEVDGKPMTAANKMVRIAKVSAVQYADSVMYGGVRYRVSELDANVPIRDGGVIIPWSDRKGDERRRITEKGDKDESVEKGFCVSAGSGSVPEPDGLRRQRQRRRRLY